MANRRFTQFHYTMHAKPVLIDCNFAVGSSGAVGTTKGPGVSSITHLGTGAYKIKLQDNYYKFYGLRWWIKSPVTGGSVGAASLVASTIYEITSVGSTDWNAVGLPSGISAAAGMSFMASGAGSGTGTAKAIGVSGINTVEVVGDPNLQLGPIGVNNQGAIIIVQCLGPTDATTTTQIPKDPASGSILGLELYLSDSSVVVQSE